MISSLLIYCVSCRHLALIVVCNEKKKQYPRCGVEMVHNDESKNVAVDLMYVTL